MNKDDVVVIFYNVTGIIGYVAVGASVVITAVVVVDIAGGGVCVIVGTVVGVGIIVRVVIDIVVGTGACTGVGVGIVTQVCAGFCAGFDVDVTVCSVDINSTLGLMLS